jgi:hypothetical protein
MVKIKLDSPYKLADIDGVAQPDALYKPKALVINGRSPALEMLSQLASTPAGRALRNGIRMACEADQNRVASLNCISEDRRKRGVFEIAQRGGGKARLFFFYLDPDRLVICLCGFWKRGSSKKERADQTRAFDKAVDLMEDFKRSII